MEIHIKDLSPQNSTQAATWSYRRTHHCSDYKWHNYAHSFKFKLKQKRNYKETNQDPTYRGTLWSNSTSFSWHSSRSLKERIRNAMLKNRTTRCGKSGSLNFFPHSRGDTSPPPPPFSSYRCILYCSMTGKNRSLNKSLQLHRLAQWKCNGL